jgi:carboxypeptidase C (cathepsin A)
MLGVDPSVGSNFSSCSNRVGRAFAAALDEYHPTYHYVAALLERNVRVLIYVGMNDWICNWVGNERWTLALEWSGRDAFRGEVLRDWMVNGKAVGSTRSAAGLTFATIRDAGHMVRSDSLQGKLEPKILLLLRFRTINLRKRCSWLTDGLLAKTCSHSPLS